MPDLVVEFCLLVARGVISLSFSPFLAGVDGTFKGSAAEDMGISGDERTWGTVNMFQANHWPVKITRPNILDLTL